MIILATIFSGLSLLMSLSLLIGQPKFPLSFWLLLPKLTAGALSPYWAIMGTVGAILGGISGALWAIPMGVLGASVSGDVHGITTVSKRPLGRSGKTGYCPSRLNVWSRDAGRGA